MSLKTILVALNIVCAVALLLTYPSFAMREQGILIVTKDALQKSGALDTNLLARYVASGEWHLAQSPMDCFDPRRDATSRIWTIFVLPSAVFMLINAAAMGLFLGQNKGTPSVT